MLHIKNFLGHDDDEDNDDDDDDDDVVDDDGDDDIQQLLDSLKQTLNQIDQLRPDSDSNQNDSIQQQKKSNLKVYKVNSICFWSNDSSNTSTKVDIKDSETQINFGATGLSAFLTLNNGLKIRLVWKWNAVYAINVETDGIHAKFVSKPVVFQSITTNKKKTWQKHNVNEDNLNTLLEHPKIFINVNNASKMKILKNMINEIDQIYDQQIITLEDWRKLTFKFCEKEKEFITDLINEFKAPYLQNHKELKKKIDAKINNLHKQIRKCVVCLDEINWFSYHPLCLQDADYSFNCANTLTSKIFNDKISYF